MEKVVLNMRFGDTSYNFDDQDRAVVQFDQGLNMLGGKVPEEIEKAKLARQNENVMDNTLEMNEMEQAPEMEATYPGRTKIVADKDLIM